MTWLCLLNYNIIVVERFKGLTAIIGYLLDSRHKGFFNECAIGGMYFWLLLSIVQQLSRNGM